jgi:hypothetical protein
LENRTKSPTNLHCFFCKIHFKFNPLLH